VSVVTHEKRDRWKRPGGTIHFVNDGIESTLDQAREAAGDRDVRIAGGGATILEYVNASLIDEFSIALSPCSRSGRAASATRATGSKERSAEERASTSSSIAFCSTNRAP
jgi:dihydrofolate reductase